MILDAGSWMLDEEHSKHRFYPVSRIQHRAAKTMEEETTA
jgi:hypothetical protein